MTILPSNLPKKGETFEQFKLRYYKSLIKDIRTHIRNLQSRRAGANEVTLGFLDALEEDYETQLAKLRVRARILTPLKEGEVRPFITADQIALAKSRNIKDFIKVGRDNKAICLFHNDKHASMHIYGTTFYCFSCSAKGDSIDIIMKLRGGSFSSAVKFLTS